MVTAEEVGHSVGPSMAKLSRKEIAQLLRGTPLGFTGEAMAQAFSNVSPYALRPVTSDAGLTQWGRNVTSRCNIYQGCHSAPSGGGFL